MQTQVHTCANGLTGLFKQQGEQALISLQFWVQTGSMDEGEQLGCGLSHLLEHMVFKGTRSYSGQELAEKVQSLGGLWNAYTSTDRTVYHIDGPAEHWREFMNILNELVFFPSFPQEEWEREREVIRREMAMYKDDPNDATYRALIETLYKSHPRRVSVIGEEAQFNRLSFEDMRNYHAQNYRPARVFVSCACGGSKVNESEFFEALEGLAQGLPAAPTRPYAPRLTEQRQWGARLCRREFAQPTSTLILGWRTPDAQHPDAAAFALLSSILGEGRAAWLYAYFHDELGSVHDVSTSLIPSREGEGAFLIEADCDRSDRDAVRDALLAYMAKVHQEPTQRWEIALQRALRQLRFQRMRSLSTVQGLANIQAISWHLTRNPDCMEEWEQALTRVRVADLLRVLSEYFNTARLCEVSIDPLGSNAAEENTQQAREEQPVQEYSLANGMRILLKQDSRVALMDATLALGAGCSTESAQTAGINNLLSELMLKGTLTRSAAQIAEGMENLGGSLNSSAGNNTLTISARCLSEDTTAMLEILADVTLKPSFPAESLETEKESIIADIRDAQEDPAALAFRELRQACFGQHSYGIHPDGRVETIQALTQSALKQHHARLCCGRNAVLCLVGDFTGQQAAILKLIEQLFADMPEGNCIQRSQTPAQNTADLKVELAKEQAVLALALPAPHIHSADVPAFTLFLEWCRDMAGPIFTEIREKRGLAYYATAANLSGVDAGCLYFYLGTAPESLAEARSALEGCLLTIAEKGMPQDALERTRATALAGRMINMQSGKRVCSSMAVDTLLGLGADYINRIPALLETVTLEEINTLIKNLLAPEQARAYVSVSPIN